MRAFLLLGGGGGPTRHHSVPWGASLTLERTKWVWVICLCMILGGFLGHIPAVWVSTTRGKWGLLARDCGFFLNNS